MNRYSVTDLLKLKEQGNKIAAITCYDFFTAKAIQDADIPVALVGDSASMLVYGYNSTVPISMDEIILLLRAVVRGNAKSFIVADMPFMSYQASVKHAVNNAGKLIKEGGATAVKLEGGSIIKDQIKAILDAGIPVVGHLGLLPQSINKLGRYSIQAKSESEQTKLMDDALLLESLGVCSLILECIPSQLAYKVSSSLSIPTIGIGAGLECDGQIQVFHDLVGLGSDHYPKHSTQYENIGSLVENALAKYKADIVNGDFKV